MPEEAQEDYGKKIEYDPLWKGPIEQTRTKTDFPFIVSLGIFLAFWIGVASYAYSAGENPFIDVSSRVKRETSGNEIIDHSLSLRQIVKISSGFIALGISLSIVYIVLLQWFAKFMVYAVISIVCFLLFGVICGTSYLYAALATNYNQSSQMLMIPLIFSITMLLAVVIIVLVLRKKINIACEVIKESTKAVIFFPSSLLFPILPTLLYAVVGLFALSVHFYLIGIKEQSGHITFFRIINIFGILWLFCFITAFTQMVLSGSFATWYWTQHKKYIPDNTILKFMGTVSRYHLGTLAFGSLILAICKLINMFLDFIRNRLQGSCNPLVCLCFCWYKFLFGNLERIISYINRNAYIMSAVHGSGFYKSAKDAFNLLMRNIVKVLVINKVTDAILYIGQLLIIGLTVLATYGWCHYQESEAVVMSSALVIVCVSTLFVTVAFFMVLRIAIDTIFLCALEDYERNDGSEEKPYYMSLRLKSLLIKDEAGL